mmetsp:Transcript_57914/g.135640  ORF Transcript_57914/g.135640 Transcript_57914/m.135640 type:complete len:144 (+) Transcript_57914:117-548(+)
MPLRCTRKTWVMVCLPTLALAPPILWALLEAPPGLVENSNWVRAQQHHLREAAQRSRKTWPLPSDFQPMFDFSSIVKTKVSTSNASSVGNEADSIPKIAKNLWVYCAAQGDEECACYGKVRWGNAGAWQVFPPRSTVMSNRIK